MKVTSVTVVKLEVAVPVYDLGAHPYENFCLANGAVVHNSKDLSDSFAGVVYGLTMQRTVWAMFGENPVGILVEPVQDLEEKSNKKIASE